MADWNTRATPASDAVKVPLWADVMRIAGETCIPDDKCDVFVFGDDEINDFAGRLRRECFAQPIPAVDTAPQFGEDSPLARLTQRIQAVTDVKGDPASELTLPISFLREVYAQGVEMDVALRNPAVDDMRLPDGWVVVFWGRDFKAGGYLCQMKMAQPKIDDLHPDDEETITFVSRTGISAADAFRECVDKINQSPSMEKDKS